MQFLEDRHQARISYEVTLERMSRSTLFLQTGGSNLLRWVMSLLLKAVYGTVQAARRRVADGIQGFRLGWRVMSTMP